MSKTSLNWQCIQGCGSCCKLAPDERSEALQALDDYQMSIYLDMVGVDGWCKNYDQATKRCLIYNERPEFCNVKNLVKLFKIDKKDLNLFAIECCRDNIKSIYGDRSEVMDKFEKAIMREPNEH